MEVLENMYAILGIIVLPILLLTLLVAAFLPKDRRQRLQQKLGRLKF